MVGKIAEFFEDIFRNTVVKMITALMLVGAFSGAVLVLVYVSTGPNIKRNLNMAREKAIYGIFKDAEKIEETGQPGVWRVSDAGGNLLGYAFKAEGNGYQGIIRIIAGISPDLTTLKGMEVLESQETPGLGAEISGESFRNQFEGLSVTQPIEYLKNEKPTRPYQIQAITGATISSRAVVNILNGKIEEMEKDIKG